MNLHEVKENMTAVEFKAILSQIILTAEKADSEACKYLRDLIQRIIEPRFQEEIQKTIIRIDGKEVPITPHHNVVKLGTRVPILKVSDKKIIFKADQLRTKKDRLMHSIQTMNANELYQILEKLKNTNSILNLEI